MNARIVITRTEAAAHAQRLKCSQRTIYRMARRGVDPGDAAAVAAFLIRTPRAARYMAIPFLASLTQ